VAASTKEVECVGISGTVSQTKKREGFALGKRNMGVRDKTPKEGLEIGKGAKKGRGAGDDVR